MSSTVGRSLGLPIAFAAIAVGVMLITQPMGSGDSVYYLRMAAHPGEFVGSPFGYRVAVPYAATLLSHLNLAIPTAFSVLQIAFFSAFSSILFYWLCDRLKLDPFVTAVVCLLFAFSFPGVYNLHNRVHVGLAEHLCLLLGCVAITQHRFLALVLVIAAAGFVKETIGALLIPTFLVFSLADTDRRAILGKLSLLSAVFVCEFLLLRTGVLFSNTANLHSYASFYNSAYLSSVYQFVGGVSGALRSIIGTFGPLWLIAAAGFATAPPQLRALATLPLLALIQIFLATDVARMVGVGIPAVLVFAALALSKVGRMTAIALALVSIAYFLCINLGKAELGAAGQIVVLAVGVAATGVLLRQELFNLGGPARRQALHTQLPEA